MNNENLILQRIAIVFFLLFIAMTGGPGFSQIVIDQADMPGPGDTLRVSITTTVPEGYSNTGMDMAWDFSALETMTQRLDTFISATSTPSAYQLFFVILGGANLASPLNTNFIPGIPISQAFTFYKNDQGSYSDLGSAYTVQELPLPIKYDIPDNIMSFQCIRV